MKNIGKIFINDIKHIYKNVIALIVVLGLSVVPSLYAWFNIAASWDPYGSTGNLKVAVASMDKGYEGSLVPLELNLGEKIMSSLRENEQLDWVFTDKDEALEGVKSGEYYAAIVIPESFSEDMMSLFSRDVHKSDILYYLNEKENAIAPKVTDKGAGAVQQQVDEIFARTVALIGLDVLDALSAVMEQEGAQTAANNLAVNVRKIAGNLEAASETVDALFNMTVSMQQMLDTTSAFLKQTGTNIEQNMELLKGTSNKAEDLDNALLGTTESISQVLEQGSACYQAV